ncbi:uncharacterized protein LOC110849289 [Folsomia candida]|uniref:Uncharacterized protein n=1 Tax=Folsomia candida TaxID=158441 RepID=A0A226EDF5_FOLCA|nr:uncharacterized protein LOC110849289 [Folsomia candida]OXA55542.1 hypothetical protein Fcan01_08667 [Folsomia candida]
MAYYSYDTYDPYYSYPVAEVAVVDVPVVEYGIEPVIYPPTSNMGYAQYDPGYYDAGYVNVAPVAYVDNSSCNLKQCLITGLLIFLFLVILVAAVWFGPRGSGGSSTYVSHRTYGRPGHSIGVISRPVVYRPVYRPPPPRPVRFRG